MIRVERATIDSVSTQRMSDTYIRKRSCFPLRMELDSPYPRNFEDPRLKPVKSMDPLNPLRQIAQEPQAHIENAVPEIPAGHTRLIGDLLTALCPHCSKDRTMTNAISRTADSRLSLFPEMPWQDYLSDSTLQKLNEAYSILRPYERYIDEPDFQYTLPEPFVFQYKTIQTAVNNSMLIDRQLVSTFALKFIDKFTVPKLPRCGLFFLSKSQLSVLSDAQVTGYYHIFFKQRPVLTKLLHTYRYAVQHCQLKPNFVVTEYLSLKHVALLLTNADASAWNSQWDVSRARNSIADIRQNLFMRRMAITRILLEHIDQVGLTCFANVLHRHNFAENICFELQNKIEALTYEPKPIGTTHEFEHEQKQYEETQQELAQFKTILHGSFHQQGVMRALELMRECLRDLEQVRDTIVNERVQQLPDSLDIHGQLVHSPEDRLEAYRAKHRIQTTIKKRANVSTSSMKTTETPELEAKIETLSLAQAQSIGRSRTLECQFSLQGCGMRTFFVYQKKCDIYFQNHPRSDPHWDFVVSVGGLAYGSNIGTFESKEDFGVRVNNFSKRDYVITDELIASWRMHVFVYPWVSTWVGDPLPVSVNMPANSTNYYITPFDIKGIFRRATTSTIEKIIGYFVHISSLIPMTRLISPASAFTNVSYAVTGRNELENDIHTSDRRLIKDSILVLYQSLLLANHGIEVAHRSVCNTRYWPLSFFLADPCLPKRLNHFVKQANSIQNFCSGTLMPNTYLPRRDIYGSSTSDPQVKNLCERTVSGGARLVSKFGFMRYEPYPYVHSSARSGFVCASGESILNTMFGREIECKLSRTEVITNEESLNYCRAFADFVQLKRMSISQRENSFMVLQEHGVVPYSKSNTDSSEDLYRKDVYPTVWYVTKPTGNNLLFDDLDNGFAHTRKLVMKRRRERGFNTADTVSLLNLSQSFYRAFDELHGFERDPGDPLPKYSTFLYSNSLVIGDHLEVTVSIPIAGFVDCFVPPEIKIRHGLPLQGKYAGEPNLLELCRKLNKIGTHMVLRQPVLEPASLTQTCGLPGPLNSATYFHPSNINKKKGDFDGDTATIKIIRELEAMLECTMNIGSEAFLAVPASGTSAIVMLQDTVTCPSAWSRCNYTFEKSLILRVLKYTLQYKSWTEANILIEMNKKIEFAAEFMRKLGKEAVAKEIESDYLQFKHLFLFVMPYNFNYVRGDVSKPLKHSRIAAGWLESGILNKEDLGKAETSIINYLVRSVPDNIHAGRRAAVDFVDDMSFIVHALCRMFPYTLSQTDWRATSDTFEKVQMCLNECRIKEQEEYKNFRASALHKQQRLLSAVQFSDINFGMLHQIKFVQLIEKLDKEEDMLALNQAIRRGDLCETVFNETQMLTRYKQKPGSLPCEGARYYMMYESGGKSSSADHRLLSVSIGHQLPYNKCMNLLNNGRRLTPFSDTPETADDRNFVSSSFTAGMSPLEHFQNDQLSRPITAESSRVNSAGAKSREWNYTFGGCVVIEDGSLRHPGGQILSMCPGDGSGGEFDEVVKIPVVKFLETHCSKQAVHKILMEGIYGANERVGTFHGFVCALIRQRNERVTAIIDPTRKLLCYDILKTQARGLTYAYMVSRVRHLLMDKYFKVFYQRHTKLKVAIREALTVVTTLARIALCQAALMHVLPNPLDRVMRLPIRMFRILNTLKIEEKGERITNGYVHHAVLETAEKVNQFRNWLYTENIADKNRQDTWFWYMYSSLTCKNLIKRNCTTKPALDKLLISVYDRYVTTRIKIGTSYGLQCMLPLRASPFQTLLQSKNSTTKPVANTKGQRRLDDVASCRTDAQNMVSEIRLLEKTQHVPNNTGYATAAMDSKNIEKWVESLFLRQEVTYIVSNVSTTEDCEAAQLTLLSVQNVFVWEHEFVQVDILKKQRSKAACVIELDVNGWKRDQIIILMNLLRGTQPSMYCMSTLVHPDVGKLFVFMQMIIPKGIDSLEKDVDYTNMIVDREPEREDIVVKMEKKQDMTDEQKQTYWTNHLSKNMLNYYSNFVPGLNDVRVKQAQHDRGNSNFAVDMSKRMMDYNSELVRAIPVGTIESKKTSKAVEAAITKRRKQKSEKTHAESTTKYYTSVSGFLLRQGLAGCVSMLPDTGINRVYKVPEDNTVRFMMDPAFFSATTILSQGVRPDVEPGSLYCTEPDIMETLCGCSAAEYAMNHEIMKSLEGGDYIHPKACCYPAIWESAQGMICGIGKTTHAAHATGFIDRAMHNDSARILFSAGAVGGIDRLEGKSAIFFGVGPKSGDNFKNVLEVPESRRKEAKQNELDQDRFSLMDEKDEKMVEKAVVNSDVKCDICNKSNNMKMVRARYTTLNMRNSSELAGNSLKFNK